MSPDPSTAPPTPATPADQGRARADYLAGIDRRLRSATWQVRARTATIQLSWVVVLTAGAAVSVVEALEWNRWIGSALGFLVVVFQGVERIFGRTSEGFRSIDVLRRDLGREKRLFQTGEGPYKDLEDPFAHFVEQAEELIRINDEEEVAYNVTLTSRA